MDKNRREQALAVIKALEREYPDALCSLVYIKPYELLIAARLAAQCTDARVNIVTKDLFARYPALESFAGADVTDVENIIRPCGLGASKARDIVCMAGMLIEEYGGIVPDTMDELLKLPGVGRKTANLILGDIYGKPAVVCDTHCIRINVLLGLSDSKNPTIAEKQLRAVLPPEKSNDYCHRIVLHGRAVCHARSPRCGECCLANHCDYANNNDIHTKGTPE
ncbi:MAG: endonuclease III [Oscillospiraceae bacterium]|nr:endonuclease III [Oscillospiraceae bacterium]